MALEPEKQKIGVQMPARALRTFRPSFPSIQLPGVQRLAKAMESVGETEAQATAREAALEQARSVSITGPNGEPVRPPTPDEFGRYAKEIFDKAIDSRYGTAVVQDSQKKIFDIFNQNQTDPQKAFELAKAHASGVIAAAPPASRPDLEKNLGSQIQSQYRGFSLQQSRMDRYNAAVGLKEQVKDLQQKADDALNRGQTAEADNYYNQARSKLLTLDGMRMLPPGRLESFDEQRLSARGANAVMTVTRSRIEAGEIDQENLLTLSKIFDGTAKDTDKVDGFDKAWVLKNVPNVGTRQAMAKWYANLHKAYVNENNKAQADIEYYKFAQKPTMPVPGKTKPAQEQNLIRFAQEQYGPNWMSPQGLQNLYAATAGQVPTTAIKRYLDNPEANADPNALKAKAEFFNQIDNFTTPDGRSVSLARDIDARDRAFYTHYLNGLKGGLDHAKALDQATTLLRTDEKGEASKDPLRFISNRMPVDKPELRKEKGIYKFIDDNVDTKSILGLIPFSGKRIAVGELPQGPKAYILQRMAAHMGYGQKPVDAARTAVREFENAWIQIPFNKTRDAASGTGWVRKDLAIPAVEIPGTGPDRTWAKRFWDDIQKAQKSPDAYSAENVPEMFITNGKPIPEGASVGKDIYFHANPNGTHTIMYDSGRGVYPVVDKDQQAIIVDLRKYAASLQENIRISSTLNAEESRNVADKVLDIAKKPNISGSPERNLQGVISLRAQKQFMEAGQKSRYYESSTPSITSDVFIKYNTSLPEGAPYPPPRPSDYSLGLKERPDVSLPQSEEPKPQPISKEYPLQLKNWADTFTYWNELNDDKGYTPRYLKNARRHTGVHRSLQEIIDIASSAMPDGYTVEITPHGGVRSYAGAKLKGSRHIAGNAMDILIRKDGKPLKNVQHGPTFRTYEQFAQLARSIQTSLYPELTGQFRWGGYFRQGVPLDMMHFDVGTSEANMALGTWKSGIRSQYISALKKQYPGLVSMGMK